MKSWPRVLVVLTLAHGLVDTFSGFVQPLWPDLQRSLALGDGPIQWAYVLWALASSVSQLAFGYWGDRARGRWLLWAGPLVGLVCLSGVGLAGSFATLSTLLILGGFGVAAFHPEAAALAGSSAPGHRSRAMSVFAVGGYLGQAAGPIYSGALTTSFGLKALVWSLGWGLPILGFLTWGLGPPAEGEPSLEERPHIPLASLVRGKRAVLSVLLLTGMFRIVPALGIPLALAYLLKGRGASNEQVGVIQAVFMGAIGAGGLGCATFLRRAAERRALWLMPLLAVPPILACPVAGLGALLACAAASGLFLGATLPILISYGQRLLPDGQRLASSITMGVTWGLGGAVVAALMTVVNRLGRPDLAFPAFVVACLVSSVLCAWLPEPEARGDLPPA